MTDIEDGTEESNLYLGVEIGGTKHQIVLGDKNGNVLCIEKGKVVLEEGAQGILRWMADHIPAMIEKAPSFGGAVRAIGVGFGGIIETATGRSVASVQVKGWKDFMLKSWFEETFRLPAVVLNDTVAGGYGEYICGAGKGSKSFFYTNIGSGIGGVFIRNGEIYDGNGYGASYLGHTYVPDMIEGTSFKQRKVEELCSGWYIEQRLRSPGYVPKESLIMELCGGKREDISSLMLENAAKAGDAFALSEVRKIAEAYGTGLANLLALLSPERIAVGGGVGKMGDLLLDPVRECVDRLAFVSVKGRYTIVSSVLNDQVVPVGAILYAARENK